MFAAFNNATYASILSTFGPLRLFVPVGSNITDVFFFVPGTALPATVAGFGAVFTDVDLPTSTSLQFFDADNDLLYSDSAPAGTVADCSLSFIGAIADAGEAIFRVRITNGTTALEPNDNPSSGIDLAAFDDLSQ